MYTEVQQVEKKIDFSSTQVIYLQDTTETILNDALNQARSMLSPFQQDQELQQLLQLPDFLNRVKRYMAQGVANVIASNDERVQAVYLFEESTNPDAETEDYLILDPTIHLLVLVESNSAALTAFFASLDRALTTCMNELPSPLLITHKSILDVIPITEDDVRNERGYASLLSSLFAPPIKIWAK